MILKIILYVSFTFSNLLKLNLFIAHYFNLKCILYTNKSKFILTCPLYPWESHLNINW